MNKRYKLTQRIPGGVDLSVNPNTLEFDTFDELKSCDWVAGYTSTIYKSFSLSHQTPRNNMFWALLMIVSEDEYNWYTVGYIGSNSPINLDLPEWKAKVRPKDNI